MAATLIDGVAIARELYAGFKERVKALASRGVRPGLAAVLIGD
ncbi:MAG: bifunctional methylenetetrahydrofolate dehydrogenase/methenyltetrahydrofolate cyclohydrolase, partial [Betaproteobacteria bacterium]|nr:bifunctional methylenetetrahydrofolate dehydrogenase/methenyltetrahydrofolate cyclohydrolase [Betaproteobacteria bacterium]